MARIVLEPKEHELRELCRTAQALKTDVPADPWLLSRLGADDLRRMIRERL